MAFLKRPCRFWHFPSLSILFCAVLASVALLCMAQEPGTDCLRLIDHQNCRCLHSSASSRPTCSGTKLVLGCCRVAANSRNDVPFGDFVDIALQLRREIPPPQKSPIVGGVNRCFQAKVAQYWKFRIYFEYRNYCIDSNQILHTDRDRQVVIVGRPTGWSKYSPNKSKTADVRHFKTVKSPSPQPSNRFLWNFVWWRILAICSRLTVKFSNFWISKMAPSSRNLVRWVS